MIEKYTLTQDQVTVLKNVHKRVMESGLTRMGIPHNERSRFMETSNTTFELMIKETQAVLKDMGEKRELMTEIKKN